MKRRFRSIAPIAVEELVGLSGWSFGPGEDSLLSPIADEVFFREEADGHLTITVQDGADATDLFEHVPFEELEDAHH
jgi:hypothetical protein